MENDTRTQESTDRQEAGKKAQAAGALAQDRVAHHGARPGRCASSAEAPLHAVDAHRLHAIDAQYNAGTKDYRVHVLAKGEEDMTVAELSLWHDVPLVAEGGLFNFAPSCVEIKQ